jgi:hypothetical protein
MSNNQNQIVIFLDAVGRTVIGERVDTATTETKLAVKNPAVVHIMPNQQTGQLQLQLLPLFFKEFLAEKDSGTTWTYNRATITESSDVVLDFKLEAQYKQIFAPGQWHSAPAPQQNGQPQGNAPQQGSQDVIKLFDE